MYKSLFINAIFIHCSIFCQLRLNLATDYLVPVLGLWHPADLGAVNNKLLTLFILTTVKTVLYEVSYYGVTVSSLEEHFILT